jgi:hypothetical protein
MNIVVVSSLTRTALANYLVGALRRAGHALLVVSDVPGHTVDLVLAPDPDLAALCAQRNFAPDLVFFIEGGTMQLFPRGLERLSCPTAWYAIDTHNDYAKHVAIAQLFDATFVAHKQFVSPLDHDGARRAKWLPPAFPSEYLPPQPQERTIDLAFVGSVDRRIYPARATLLAELTSMAKTSAVGPTDPEEMLRRYVRAKVVFNSSVKGDLNMRYFEAMGSGAVLLTDFSKGNGIEDLFEPERHFVPYFDERDLFAKFEGLLRDDDRRASIGDAARRLVLDRHTYDHRAAAIVEHVRGVEKSVYPTPAGYFAAFGALNMPAAALRAASAQFVGMGQGSRTWPLNRAIAVILRAFAACSDMLIRGMRRLARR